MRILYLCHRIPYPPNKGDKIRAFHQLKALSRVYEVDLFTLCDGPVDPEHRSALLQYCQSVTVVSLNPLFNRIRALPYLLTQVPLTVPCFHSPELHKKVRNALAEQSYDRIFVYSSSMMQYIEPLNDIPILMDLVDVDSNKWSQYSGFVSFPFSVLYRREARCLRQLEQTICNKAACVIVTTQREARLVTEISTQTNVRVVPNGVDTEYFHVPQRQRSPRNPAIIFTGDMSYFPNTEAVAFFARKVLPIIRQSIRDVQFLIVGRTPTRGIRQLAAIGGVEITGFVPDVRPYFERASVAVAPFSITAGIPNKILEAMASGLPVVGTSRGVQGLIPAVGTKVDIGDTEEELAAKTVALLGDPSLARRKGLECRNLVSLNYDWEKTASQLLDLVEAPASFHAKETSQPH